MTLPADLARRYDRQTRLAEIGESGQAKLCAARVSLGAAGFARTMEERYVLAVGLTVGVGLESIASDSSTIETQLAALGLRHTATHEVAEGALRALIALHSALGKTP